MLLLANFFWGLSFPVIKAITFLHAKLVPAAGPWFSTVYTVAPRFGLAVVFMALWYRDRLRRPTGKEVRQGLWLGFFAAGGMLLQNDGLQFTTASTSAFLTQLYAVMIPIWIAFRQRQHPGRRVWLSCALVLVGAAILSRFDVRHVRLGRGEWETIASSFFFMGQILWLENRSFAGNRSLHVTFIMFATEAAIFLLCTALLRPSPATLLTPWTSPSWLALTLLLTFFCTFAAFSLMNAWQPKISATEAGLVYCVEPIFASLLALFLPAWFSAWAGVSYANEHLTWTLLVGGGLITLANLVIQLRRPNGRST